MATIFHKQMRCFYCGSRSSRNTTNSVRKWQCTHCDAVNYLDEKGEITDPPACETNPGAFDVGAASQPFESIDYSNPLFCGKCVRNQRLFINSLASYFPDLDDPAYPAYEREYPKFRRNLEERYPQVCANCESRVMERIRQTRYEAKADHLRRMMEHSKTGRIVGKARRRNWRSLLVFAGAVGHWGSVAGQLFWHLMGSIDYGATMRDEGRAGFSLSLSCIKQAIGEQHVESQCSSGLAPYAGLALLLGILSLWWNPKLRLKIEGRSGRFVGLAEYYKSQLIIIVVRFVAWALLKDPTPISVIKPSLSRSIHIFMIGFIVLAVLVSRYVVYYDTRPLVVWSDDTPQVSPNRKKEAASITDTFSARDTPQCFPLEKLLSPRPTSTKEPPTPPTPPDVDDMDWTPSQRQTIRPTFPGYKMDNMPVTNESSPFYGSLPATPTPPSWKLRNPVAQKPDEQVAGSPPFYRASTQPQVEWNQRSHKEAANNPPSPSFTQPKFFPPGDYTASTGLEALFDRAFTIRSLDDEPSDNRPLTAHSKPSTPVADANRTYFFRYFRLGLLATSVIAWQLCQSYWIAALGKYVEIISLGSMILIAGFALLETLKQPIVHWTALEVLFSVGELATAVYLGGKLPNTSFGRTNFDVYGKSLLIFMTVQEAVGLLLPLIGFLQPRSAR